MKKIKIAQVITRMDWGGSPDIVRIILEGLDERIYDARLIYGITAHPSKKTEEFFKKFKDSIICVPQLRREINIFNDALAFLKIYRLFRKERFDIVHTHTAKAGILGRIAARLARVPYIVHSPHGHNFYGYFKPLINKGVIALEKIAAIFTDKILALTELEKRDFVNFKAASPEKLAVIYSGLELGNYGNVRIDRKLKKKELGIEKDSILVGMVGRLEPIKGSQYMVEAAPSIIKRFPGVKFLIVGEGSIRNKLESRCRELGIFDNFIFTGWREDIPEILSIVDILALPSLNEAVGRVLIEAGAMGIPVVASRVGGVPEIVKDNETGILINPGDPDSLAKGIMTLLEDSDKKSRMGLASRKWIDDRFSAQKMVEEFTALYDGLVKFSSPPHRS